MLRYGNSIIFAVVWTLVVMALAWPVGPVRMILLTVCGMMAGASFHLMMDWWTERQSERGS